MRGKKKPFRLPSDGPEITQPPVRREHLPLVSQVGDLRKRRRPAAGACAVEAGVQVSFRGCRSGVGRRHGPRLGLGSRGGGLLQAAGRGAAEELLRQLLHGDLGGLGRASGRGALAQPYDEVELLDLGVLGQLG